MFVRLLPLGNKCLHGFVPKITVKQSLSTFAQETKLSYGKITSRGFSTATKFEARAGRAFTAKKAPVTGAAAISIGQMSVAGASVVGLGALCYYGLGLANETGAIDRAATWPKFIRERIRDTYLYFGGSLAATAAAAVAISRNPSAMRIVSGNGVMSIVLSLGAMIGTSIVCRSIDYKPGFGAKQLAWLLHTSVIGAVIAPITILGGPLLVRAAWLTAGIVGGLSAVAVCAPSDKFLSMGGPLAAGLGAVFVASLGSAFFPPTNALGLSLYSISVYGGLILFGAFLLYDTQRIVKKAETHPFYSTVPYDPVNASMSIYMDAINIFIRLAMIMAGQRKK